MTNQDKEFKKFLRELIEPSNGYKDVDEKSLKEVFEEKLVELDLAQFQVERFLKIERKTLNGILSGTAKRVDVLNILKLARFLDIRPQDILNMYVTEMSSDLIGDLENAGKSSFIINNFDIPHLRKGKFIKGKADFEKIEERINKFFGFNKITQYNAINVSPMFSRTQRSSNNLMREFWIKSAFVHFNGIKNPNQYDRDLLVELIPKIRPYTINVEKGLITIAKALFNIGITLIYQPSLPTVQARAATFKVNSKPCIVLTDSNKNYPTLWFALIHELHHVLYDFEEISKLTFHITGEEDLFLMEDAANNFAREYLFSKERSKYIEPLIHNTVAVKEFTKTCQVHESFAYNFYNYDKSLQGDAYAWSRFKSLFPDIRLAIKDLNSSLWDKETIQESIDFYNEKVFELISK